MQIEMTIDAKRSQIPPLVSESGTLQGGDLMMDLKPPCSAAIGTPPAIPFQDPPPDPLPAIPQRDRDASSSNNRRLESGSCGSAFPAGPIPSPGGQKKRSSGIITSAVITALLDETEGSLIVILDESHREGSLQDGSRLPFDRERAILGHLPESAYVLRCFAPSGLPRLDKGSRSPDLILEFGQPETDHK